MCYHVLYRSLHPRIKRGWFDFVCFFLAELIGHILESSVDSGQGFMKEAELFELSDLGGLYLQKSVHRVVAWRKV